jgi:hypothetical protein
MTGDIIWPLCLLVESGRDTVHAQIHEGNEAITTATVVNMVNATFRKSRLLPEEM